MSNRAERRRDAKRRPTLTADQIVAKAIKGDVWQFNAFGLRVTNKFTGQSTFYPGV